ncbi:MAG: RNAse HI domain-containing protein [Candidatus Thiodiazotropha sp. (ex Ctena orbiculata)]|nr:RNAse HI domain-containing protein [Candidatus Thiodiazotropha taylori]
MKMSSLKYISETHSHKVKIYTDGSKDPTANTAGAAFVAPELDHTTKIKLNPVLSVFTTELVAIEHAITWILKSGISSSVILTDSLSTVQALQIGKSRSRPDKVEKILSLLNLASTVNFNISIEWIPAHVGIEGNEAADQAAKEAMVSGNQDPTRPAKSEIYHLINDAINKKWQTQWTHNNKGRMFHFGQPTVKTKCEVYSTNRRLDTVYTRLRLGHCGLGYHHPGNQHGLCPHCGDTEDLDHVFFDCEAHNIYRRDLESSIFKLGYTQIDLRTILFPPKKHADAIQNAVFEFLRKTQYMDKI